MSESHPSIRSLQIAGTLLFATAFYWGVDYHGTRAFAFYLLGAAWLAGITWKRVHWSAGLLLGWSLFSAFRISASPSSPYHAFGDGAVSSLDALTMATACGVVLVTALALQMNKWDHAVVRKTFGWICALDSLYVVAQWCLGNDSVHRGGFFGNASMNACVIAITYPMLTSIIRRPKYNLEAWWYLACLGLPLVAVMGARSNMATAAMVAALMLPVFTGRTKIIGPLTLCAGTAGMAIHFMGEKFANTDGRMGVWRAAMSWWWDHGHGWGPQVSHWLGTGLGTYFLWGPNIQIRDLGMRGNFFYWMHNDFLQILFEMGFVGLGLAALMYSIAVYRAVRDGRTWLVSSLAAFGVTMLGNFPLHLPVSGFLGAFLIVSAFRF